MSAEFVFLGLGDIFGDFNLIIKIFVLMTIYSWVKNHIQNTTLGLIIFGAISVFVFGELWTLFGGIYIFWMLLMFGVSQILIDFFFIAPQPGQEMGSPVDSGKDIADRQKHAAHMQQGFAQGFMRRR
ncbi:MAG: hypothetical protein AABW85_02890 [archaeon]